MKSLLILGFFLCVGYAAAATTTTTTTTPPPTTTTKTTEIPEHIQTFITNHINQVLQQVKNKPHSPPNTLTGHVQQEQQVGTPVVKPFSGLLPPIAHSSSEHTNANDKPKVAHTLQSGPQSLQTDDPQVRVINHVATATLLQRGQPVVQNKVVMPPVSQVVVSLPGEQQTPPINIADKVHQLQHHVNYVMQQAQTHIPQALQQAIKEKKKKQQEQQQKEKEQLEKDRTSTTSTTSTPMRSNQKNARSITMPFDASNMIEAEDIPDILETQRREMDLGKCNFDCPAESLTICATNGKCVVNFPGQCELSQWNCFNTKNVFHQVHDADCQNTIKCYQRDMMM
ncbi:ras guanine nucleotide exchange factor B [Drosophila tropicalis]|uniref:ras guanine nucleotide exchange factor B n=1 Tax=Drosophila tropicalis TaxID=46794 RepID=UPI0035AC1E8E